MRGATCWLRYRGEKGTFRYVSAADVMNGRTPPDALRDKIVLRRHQRARHARGGRDTARHAVCRRRGAGDRGRQPAAGRLSSRALRRHGSARWSAVLIARPSPSRSCSPSTGVVAGLLGGAVGVTGSVDRRAVWLLVVERRVHFAALCRSIGIAAELSVMTLANFRFEREARRSAPAASGRRRAALAGRDPALADRDARRRDGASFAAHAAVRQDAAPDQLADEPRLPPVPDARAHRSAGDARADSRHRQGRHPRPGAQQARTR